MDFQFKFKHFHSRKRIWRWCLRNGAHFVSPQWQSIVLYQPTRICLCDILSWSLDIWLLFVFLFYLLSYLLFSRLCEKILLCSCCWLWLKLETQDHFNALLTCIVQNTRCCPPWSITRLRRGIDSHYIVSIEQAFLSSLTHRGLRNMAAILPTKGVTSFYALKMFVFD